MVENMKDEGCLIVVVKMLSVHIMMYSTSARIQREKGLSLNAPLLLVQL